MPRSAAALSLSASSQSPIATSASIWLATSRALSIPYRRSRLEPRLPQSRRLSGPAQHRQHVGEIDVRSFQADAIADLLGELQGLTKVGETLVAAAEVGEVAAEHGERSDLCLACADTPSERERLLGNRQRLRIAPGHHQRPGERPQRIRALRRRRLRRHELDRALERGEAGVVHCRSRARYSPRRTWRSAARCGSSSPTSSIARRPSSTAAGGTDLAGELGRPGAELGEVELSELGRVRDGGPQRERPLEVGEGLGEAEDGLGLARRFDRGDERFCCSTGGRPVRRELRCCCRSAAGELVGEPRVQLLALTWQDRRVDRLGQERVAEAEACRRPDRPRGRRARPPGAVTHARRARAVVQLRGAVGTRRRVRRPRPDAAGSASDRSSRATRRSSRSRRPVGSAAVQVAGGGDELFCEEGIAFGAGDDRVRQRTSAGEHRRGRRAAPPSPQRSSGPSSSTSAEPERLTPSASRCMRSADDGSSAR